MRPSIRLLPVAAFLAAFLVVGSALAGGPARFRRGDSNADAQVDLSDSVLILGHLFVGDPGPSCLDSADVNDDGCVDISDAIQLLQFLFAGGKRPAFPSFACAADPTGDELTCEEFAPCVPAPDILPPRLGLASGCQEVLASIKERFVEKMTEAVERNRSMALDMVRSGGCWWYRLDDFYLFGGITTASTTGSLPASPGAGEEASEYSSTNNQVEGVDEADFVKNDGGYIYILADGRFQVIDAWPPAEARRIASFEVAGTPKKLFVHAGRAVIYSSLEPLQPEPQDPWGPWGFGGPVWRGPGECTYGYDCEFTGDGRKLKITVLDIADREHPALIREIEFTGSFLAGRRIGEMVHTVLIYPESIVPGVSYWPEELEDIWTLCESGNEILPWSEADVNAMFDRLEEENLAVVAAASEADFLPSYRDTRYEGGVPQTSQVLLGDCENFLVSPSGDGTSLLSLVSFPIDRVVDIQATTVVGRPGAVYASLDSFYIATRHQAGPAEPWYFENRQEVPEATTVHKFRLFYSGGGSEYIGSGVVKGRVLNQFSLDEQAGFLRIATTTGHLPSAGVHSTVSVLAPAEEGLVLAGQIDQIAPGEDIRSVRFDGDAGYIVTFKKTDPLFVLDLSDPVRPAIRGELKIPGFSTYLHMLDEDHILSIGFDADDQGSFAWFQGILLQVFNVADPENPFLLHREVIGTRGSTSDAATDHLAFNYFRPKGLLGIPIVVCEGGASGTYGSRITFDGLLVYRVGLEKGFERIGGVPHSEPKDSRASCSHWWTDQDSQVKRSIFMDDFVYSVALDAIDLAGLGDLEHPLARISLGK